MSYRVLTCRRLSGNSTGTSKTVVRSMNRRSDARNMLITSFITIFG